MKSTKLVLETLVLSVRMQLRFGDIWFETEKWTEHKFYKEVPQSVFRPVQFELDDT